jgi:DNA-binding winged helix-turn-helix (wHTH) protein
VTAVFFGSFVLDLQTRELRRDNEFVPLSPKAYQLLEVLVVNRPKALSKSALQDQLWPDTFVLDKNLVNLVAEIREALGDIATHPQFVRTVPKFGYAFRHSASTAGARMSPASARFRLVWPGGRAALTEGVYVLGRDPDLELFLDAHDVSRRHARISIVGDDATIEDLDSKNGTFVSNQRVNEATALVDGTPIRIGSVSLTFSKVQNCGSTQSELDSER